jgi:hypothetical protein
VALIVGLGFLSHGPFIKRWRLFLADRLSWEAYLATFPGSRALPPYVLEDWEVSQAIREGAEEEETLFVWGSKPLVYYFSGRSPATSFLYVNHLYMPGARGEAMKNRLEEELLAQPPGHILVYLSGSWIEALDDLQRRGPRVYDLIMSRYWLSGKMGPYLIYERMREQMRSDSRSTRSSGAA